MTCDCHACAAERRILAALEAAKPRLAYTAAEIAEMYGVSSATVYRWMNSGLPYLKYGSIRRITPSAVEAFLRSAA